MDTQTIGARVRRAIADRASSVTQYQVAEAVGMTPDALSRATNDKRAFSSVELARLADYLGVEVHWLITGEPDPHRRRYAARHRFDRDTGARDVLGRDQDELILADLELAYRQAGSLPPSHDVPRTPAEMREVLGSGFVRPFIDRLEERLAVDVVRVPDLSTGYSFAVDGRYVIAVPATGNWFWENFSLAHELAHVAAGHLDDEPATEAAELAANRWAADLLMPRADVVAADFPSLTVEGLASWVWDHGVSIDATANRLDALGIEAPLVLREWMGQKTQRLLRRHWRCPEPGLDAITARMDEAARRRFPQPLLRAHVDLVESGAISARTLAWMLDVAVDELEVEPPARPGGDVDELAVGLGLMPTP